MMNWKKQICTAAFALALAVQLLPGTAAADELKDPAGPTQGTGETKPAFQNPQGMTVDLVYYYLDEKGEEQEAGKAERTVIPAGTAVISQELQTQLLPKGYALKDPKEIPLEEDTLEVKILVEVKKDAGEKPADPTEPEDGPNGPTEKPEDPTEKPTEPSEKPTEPKPTEPKPTEPKPTEPKPTEPKPAKPNQKPDKKPDNTNPKTEDPFALGLWVTLGLGSACALAVIGKKKIF